MQRLISFFQNVESRNQLTSTMETCPGSPADEVFSSLYRAPAMKRVVSQLIVHPRVEVSKIREVSGGRRRYGSRAGGRVRDVVIFFFNASGVAGLRV